MVDAKGDSPMLVLGFSVDSHGSMLEWNACMVLHCIQLFERVSSCQLTQCCCKLACVILFVHEVFLKLKFPDDTLVGECDVVLLDVGNCIDCSLYLCLDPCKL